MKRTHALLFLLWPVASNGNAADTVPPSGESEWYLLFRDAEETYKKMIGEWRLALSKAREEDAGVVARRADLNVQEEILTRKQNALQERQVDLNQRLAATQEGQAVRNTIMDEISGRIADAHHAVEVAVSDLETGLDTNPKGKAARRALDGWWNAYRFLDWDALEAHGADPREPFRSALAAEAAALGEGPAAAVEALMRLATEEAEVRHAGRDYVLRNPPQDDSASIQEEMAAVSDELRKTDGQLADLQGELKAMGTAMAVSKGDRALLDESRGLVSTYARLESLLEDDPAMSQAAISRDVLCRLSGHSGVAGVLSGLPTGLDHLRVAVSVYGGPCTEVLAQDLDVLPIQAAWSEALFLESKEAPAWVVIDEDGGTWTLDGQRVDGAGLVRVSLSPTVHRITLTDLDAEGKTDALIEDFKPGDHIGLRASGGKVVLDVLQEGAAEWVIPVRHEVFGTSENATSAVVHDARSDDGSQSGVRLVAGGLWTRLESYDHFGAGVTSSVPIVRGSRLDLYAAGTLEAGASDSAYRYSTTWSMPVLMRGWLGLGVSTSPDLLPGGLVAGAEVNGGSILPARAALLGASTWIAWTLPKSSLFIESRAGALLPIWSDGAGAWEPEARMSLGIRL